ncbi:MAG: GNAT family N-acetyltransferase [Prevotellaceae bacterium]|nr:GNAT family N-acetyltransferase [Prevotellaceae bacterium]
MGFLLDKCSFSPLDEDVISKCRPFSCGNTDLDEFFQHDAPLYSRQMLGKSYCFRLDEDSSVIVCAFTLSNDSIRVDILPNSREKKVRKNIPHSKQMRRFPGVLIGRLGINTEFAGRGIGSELMDFIKSWFIDAGNKTGCRFLIVDAYNEEKPLGYYQKNGFMYLFSSESQEADNTGVDKNVRLKTRLMYFDLISLVSKSTE